MKDPQTKRSRGFGFITYSHSYMVDEAQKNRPHKIEGRIVEPKRAVPREIINKPNASATVNKIFVGNHKQDIEEEELREYFSSFGNIISVNMITEKGTNKKRGFSFVEFDDYDPVDRICFQIDHQIKGRLLDVKKALPRSDTSGGGSRRTGGGGSRGNSQQHVQDWGNSGGYAKGGGEVWGNQNPWTNDIPGNNWDNQCYGNNSGGWANYQQNYSGGPIRTHSNTGRSQPYGGGMYNQGNVPVRRY